MPEDRPAFDEAVAPEDLGLEQGEVHKVDERAALRAVVVHAAILKEGEEELRRPSSALAFSGLAAGLSMGFSLMTEGLIRSHLPETDWAPLFAKFGYSVGFLVVILGRQQLFTENTLTVVLPLLHHKTLAMLLNVLRLWGVVLATNIAGAALFAWAVSSTDIFPDGTRRAFAEIGLDALSGAFGTILLRGIFAGWLIALMVWLLPSAESARVAVIIIITYIVGLGGLAHIIAGSVETLYVVWTGGCSWLAWAGRWMLPTLIGNILGGVSLVAVLNHAQVVSGNQRNA